MIDNIIADTVAKLCDGEISKIYNKIIQTQLQMRMIKKHRKQDIYICRRKTEHIDDLTFNIIV